MGYTHYIKRGRTYTTEEWAQIAIDVKAILNDVQHVQGIPLALDDDQPGRAPRITTSIIWFNGVGEDGHETFVFERVRHRKYEGDKNIGWSFCKTAQKPYDLAVTAILAYLATLDENPVEVSSDGDPEDWLAGVELARRVIPRRANQIDIPRPILRAARWDWRRIPRLHLVTDKFSIGPCIDGKTYVMNKDESAAYCFPTHEDASKFIASKADVLSPSGRFDKKRIASLRRRQNALLKRLIDTAPLLGRDQLPPAIVRPAIIPKAAKTLLTINDILEQRAP